jgi:hypothetical protein
VQTVHIVRIVQYVIAVHTVNNIHIMPAVHTGQNVQNDINCKQRIILRSAMRNGSQQQ